MSTSSATLNSLWIDDTGSPTKTLSLGTPSKGDIKEEFEKYFREDESLTPLAKQAGILDTQGELVDSSKTLSAAGGDGASATTSGGHTYIYVASPSKLVVPGQQAGTSASNINGLVTKQQISGNGSNTTTQRVTVYPSTSHNNPPVYITTATDSRKRPADNQTLYTVETIDAQDSKRARKGEKGSKGLRHFSMKVCEKVQRKGITTYNEVADELVTEFTDPQYVLTEQAHYDQKNIRRRVYDALNVLMAMNIISKEKKEIRWIGLPTNSAQECQNLELELARRKERIQHKKQQLQELVLQQIAYKNLVQRNKNLERNFGAPPENSTIQLPFVIVNTDKKTVIDCSISNDKSEYLFNFDNTFEIHDDIEVLKRMGLAYGLEKGECSSENLRKAIDLLPRSLEPYLKELASSTTAKESMSSTSAQQSTNGGSSSTSIASTSIARQQSVISNTDDLFSDESNHSTATATPFLTMATSNV